MRELRLSIQRWSIRRHVQWYPVSPCEVGLSPVLLFSTSGCVATWMRKPGKLITISNGRCDVVLCSESYHGLLNGQYAAALMRPSQAGMVSWALSKLRCEIQTSDHSTALIWGNQWVASVFLKIQQYGIKRFTFIHKGFIRIWGVLSKGAEIKAATGMRWHGPAHQTSWCVHACVCMSMHACMRLEVITAPTAAQSITLMAASVQPMHRVACIDTYTHRTFQSGSMICLDIYEMSSNILGGHDIDYWLVRTIVGLRRG